MWNPNTYRDTDFGLPDDERFEPPDAFDEVFEPEAGEPYIQTVLGPIRPDEAEVALVHEHLQWRPTGVGDAQAALVDLEAAFTASARTIVSATPEDAGRDAGVLITLAQHAPVHIVASAGWSSQRTGWLDPDDLRVRLSREIDNGLDGTPARPGMLVGHLGGGETAEAAREALQVLAAAQTRSGLPITLTCEGPEHVEMAFESGIDPGSLVVGGQSVRQDSIADSVAARGAYVLIAPLEGANDTTDRHAAGLVAALVSDGWGDRVLVSSGFRERSRLNGYGGQPGLAYLVEQFAVMLLESGLEAPDVRSMLADNAARALSVRRAQESA